MSERQTVLVTVTWDDGGCDCGGPHPDPQVEVPLDVYEADMTSWDDEVSDWLSNTYGHLVSDWRPA